MTPAWPHVRLAEVLRPVSRVEEVDPSREYKLLGARWYAHGLFIKEIASGHSIGASKLYVVQEGDFVYNRLFAWKGSFALARSQDSGCYVSNEFPTFTVDSTRLVPLFLMWWFRREETWFEALGLSAGATPTSRNRLKEERLLSLEIPLPPPAEQQRIVERLEGLFGLWYQAKSLRQELSNNVSALVRSSAVATFSRLREPAHEVSLGSVVRLAGGGTPSKTNPLYWDGVVPWVTPKDMKTPEITGSLDRITPRATSETSAKLIDPGAVLVVVRGMILAHTVPAAVLRVQAAINQDMKAMIPSKTLDAEYLCSFLWAHNSELLSLVDRSTHDTRKLQTKKLLEFRIPRPPIEVQREVVAELRTLEAEIDHLRDVQSAVAIELDAVFPAALDRAFRGGL